MTHSTAVAISQHYDGRKSGGWYRLACPAHGGTKRSLAICDGEHGGIMAVCHSQGCAYADVMTAFRDDGILPPQTWTYADGRRVTRTDHRGGGKDISQTRNADAGGSTSSPVMVSGPASGPVILVEGERAFDAILSVGGRAACYRGGSGQVRRANFAPLAGENVLIWPDNDDPGLKAAGVAAQRIHEVGAATINMLAPVGDPESGFDAADIQHDQVQAHIDRGGAEWLPPPETVFESKDAVALAGAFLAMNLQVRLNTRTARVEVLGTDDEDWAHLDDEREAWTRGTIGRTYTYMTSKGPRPLVFGRLSWQDCVSELCHTRRVDPFKAWLETLPPWDGDQRLEFMLTQVFDAPLDDLSKWASRTTMVGAVVRARTPGAPIDEIPVLLGPQGIGKSKLWPALFPDAYQDTWASDELDFSGQRKAQIESTLGRVIVEAGELAGLSGADMSRLKTYLSRTNDGAVRLAYAHRPTPIMRRFVIVGTTDDPNCLPNDPAGNRRFVVVSCPSNALNAPVEAWAEANREQLWAEAIHLADQGDDARLPFDLHQTRDDRNTRHRSSNETVESAVTKIDASLFPDGGTMLDLVDSLFSTSLARMVLERAHQREVGRALRFAGWYSKQRRRSGKMTRLWFCPE